MAHFEVRFQLSPPIFSLDPKFADKFAASKLAQPFALANAQAHILPENQLALVLESSTAPAALEQAKMAAEKLCMLLTLGQRAYFKAQFKAVYDAHTGQPITLPRQLSVGGAHLYSIDYLAEDLEFAAPNVQLSDAILEKALAYFHHAMYMAEELELYTLVDFHELLILSDIVLHFYKSISTIIGEPGVDRDAQSRYRNFEIERELWDDTEKVRKLRNSYDAAHYSPGWQAIEKLQEEWDFARDVARRIITRYIRWLASRSAS
jgi:hypothetical protein